MVHGCNLVHGVCGYGQPVNADSPLGSPAASCGSVNHAVMKVAAVFTALASHTCVGSPCLLGLVACKLPQFSRQRSVLSQPAAAAVRSTALRLKPPRRHGHATARLPGATRKGVCAVPGTVLPYYSIRVRPRPEESSSISGVFGSPAVHRQSARVLPAPPSSCRSAQP